MPRVLVCPPNYFDVIDQKNPYMSLTRAVDRVKARTQWENLCSVLQQNGCEIETINPGEDLEDMVFAANQLFVGQKSGHGKFVVPSRMIHPSRQREVPLYVEWCRAHDYRVIEIDYGEDFLEGHGDLLWHPDGSRIYGGHGFRSTRGGVEKFSTAMTKMGIDVIPLELIDPYCYHLDTCLCPLNNDAALIFAGAFSADGLASVHKYWTRIHLLNVDGMAHLPAFGLEQGRRIGDGDRLVRRTDFECHVFARIGGDNHLYVQLDEFLEARRILMELEQVARLILRGVHLLRARQVSRNPPGDDALLRELAARLEAIANRLGDAGRLGMRRRHDERARQPDTTALRRRFPGSLNKTPTQGH